MNENIGSTSFTSFSPKKIKIFFAALGLSMSPSRSDYRAAIIGHLKKAKGDASYRFNGYNHIELTQIMIYLNMCYLSGINATETQLLEKNIPRFGYGDPKERNQAAEQIFVFSDYYKLNEESILDSLLEFSQTIEVDSTNDETETLDKNDKLSTDMDVDSEPEKMTISANDFDILPEIPEEIFTSLSAVQANSEKVDTELTNKDTNKKADEIVADLTNQIVHKNTDLPDAFIENASNENMDTTEIQNAVISLEEEIFTPNMDTLETFIASSEETQNTEEIVQQKIPENFNNQIFNQVLLNNETSEMIKQQFGLSDNVTVILANQIKCEIPTELIDDGFIEVYSAKCDKSNATRQYQYYCIDKVTFEKITLKQIRKEAEKFLITKDNGTYTTYKCGLHPDCKQIKETNRKNNVTQHIAQDKFVAVCLYCEPPRIFPKYANIGRHFIAKHSDIDLKMKIDFQNTL